MRQALSIILLLVVGVIGFVIGSMSTDSEIKYVKGDMIHDTIEVEKLIPYRVEVPNKPILPISENYIVDTAAIIQDYTSKKYYDLVAFDNKELGKLELFPVLQYNDLVKFDYSFTPIQQRKSITKKFYPFISASYFSVDYLGVGGGFFYKNIGFEYQYMIGYNRNKNAHSFGLKYRF